MSQEAAARGIGSTQSAWASWEADSSFPEIDYAQEIERLTKGEICMTDWAKARKVKRDRERPKPGPKSKRTARHARSVSATVRGRNAATAAQT